MRGKRRIFVIALAILSGCTLSGQRESLKIFNQSVYDALRNQNIFLHKPRNELELSSGIKAHNCSEYLDAPHPRAISENVNNEIAYGDYLICDTIEALQKTSGKPEYSSTIEDYGEMIAGQLDIRSFPSSMGPSITNNSFTLTTVTRGDIKTDKNTVELDNGDWLYRLEIVAAGNFNNNSREDLLLWLTDESKTGNYRGHNTLIIYDPAYREPMSAVPLPHSDIIAHSIFNPTTQINDQKINQH